MTGLDYIKNLITQSDLHYKRLMTWYEQEKEMSLIPESIIESFSGLLGALYLSFSYEMESLEKWYAVEFDKIKFGSQPPLSDKATDQKLKILENGQRIITLERRLKAIKLAKSSISDIIRSRIEQKKEANFQNRV